MRILIVDSEPGFADRVTRALVAMGCVVDIARDAIEGRHKALEASYDLVLSDSMPTEVEDVRLRELLARVQTLLQKDEGQDQTVMELGDLQLDLITHRATRSGKRLNLSAQDFKLLALLLRRQGQVQSRTILAEQVWGIHFDCDTNVVDVAVRRLRKKVDDPFSVKLVHTVRGVGYVMEARA